MTQMGWARGRAVQILEEAGFANTLDEALNLLLWFGFLGIQERQHRSASLRLSNAAQLGETDSSARTWEGFSGGSSGVPQSTGMR